MNGSMQPDDGCELPLIDQSVMSDWSGDLDLSDVLDVLARVPDEGRKCLDDLNKALEAGDLVIARRAAHRLKGMASNLGAVRLARLARSIELDTRDVGDLSVRTTALKATLSETLAAVRSHAEKLAA